jgi:hypothetical protein
MLVAMETDRADGHLEPGLNWRKLSQKCPKKTKRNSVFINLVYNATCALQLSHSLEADIRSAAFMEI